MVQFGVDVMENLRYKHETHGCIVAILKFFLDSEDGKPCSKAANEEAKGNKSVHIVSRNIPSADLFRLNQYMQEALQREQLLDTKLKSLQQIIELTRFVVFFLF